MISRSPPCPLTRDSVIPVTPTLNSASLTSRNRSGRMSAVMSFMLLTCEGGASPEKHGVKAEVNISICQEKIATFARICTQDSEILARNPGSPPKSCARCTNSTTLRRPITEALMPPSAAPDVVVSRAHSATSPAPAHPLDQVSLGKIVQIRARLLVAQAAGKRVYRFESGDPSFAPPAHVLDAITQAALAGKTHYVPNNGIPELRRALAQKVASKNHLTSTRPDDIFVTNGAMHALYVAFGSLLGQGDEVIIPDPMWTEVAEN